MMMQIAHVTSINRFAAIIGDSVVALPGEPVMFDAKRDVEQALTKRGVVVSRQVREVKSLKSLELPR